MLYFVQLAQLTRFCWTREEGERMEVRSGRNKAQRTNYRERANENVERTVADWKWRVDDTGNRWIEQFSGEFWTEMLKCELSTHFDWIRWHSVYNFALISTNKSHIHFHLSQNLVHSPLRMDSYMKAGKLQQIRKSHQITIKIITNLKKKRSAK